jgi:hypothetical protein
MIVNLRVIILFIVSDVNVRLLTAAFGPVSVNKE